MVAPVEVGEGGVELLVGNGLLKQDQAGNRNAVGAACLAAHTKHGRRSRAHIERGRAINVELRRITLELRRDGLIP